LGSVYGISLLVHDQYEGLRDGGLVTNSDKTVAVGAANAFAATTRTAAIVAATAPLAAAALVERAPLATERVDRLSRLSSIL